MIDKLLCPECVTGKHENCDGIADYKDDNSTDRCECVLGLHPYRRAIVVPEPIIAREVPAPPEGLRLRSDYNPGNMMTLSDVEIQNSRGDWVPAVPLPFFHWFKIMECHCGKLRLGMKRYQEHYAYAHILGMEDDK